MPPRSQNGALSRYSWRKPLCKTAQKFKKKGVKFRSAAPEVLLQLLLQLLEHLELEIEI